MLVLQSSFGRGYFSINWIWNISYSIHAADGIFTSTGHNLSVNDRLLFAGSVPTILSGSAGGDASLSATRYYFVQSVTTNTFTISETRSATTPIKFTNTGSGLTYKVVTIADIVRGAPIPVGGSLKVISGQKLVLEATIEFLHTVHLQKMWM